MLPAAITASALVLLAQLLPAQGNLPKVGEPFPIDPYPRLGSNELCSVADFRGKKLLLIQFASW